LLGALGFVQVVLANSKQLPAGTLQNLTYQQPGITRNHLQLPTANSQQHTFASEAHTNVQQTQAALFYYSPSALSLARVSNCPRSATALKFANKMQQLEGSGVLHTGFNIISNYIINRATRKQPSMRVCIVL
jgi:hypothetical protein